MKVTTEMLLLKEIFQNMAALGYRRTITVEGEEEVMRIYRPDGSLAIVVSQPKR